VQADSYTDSGPSPTGEARPHQLYLTAGSGRSGGGCRTVFEFVSSGIALMNAELVCTDANPAFCALAARAKTEIVGQSISRFLGANQHDIGGSIDQALRTDGQWQGALSVLRGDGTDIAVEWLIIASSPGGTRIAIAADVTHRRAEADWENLLEGERAARAEAERLNRIKDEFLATLSHELRNPLSAILGWVNVLKRSPDVTPDILKGLEVIERNSRLQTHLIADLLDYAGMRFGKMDLEIVAIHPAAALQGARAVAAPLAESRKIRLDWHVADRDARVLGDGARLQQVVWSLVTNAVKFTPEGGCVTVSARAIDGQYEISVADTGRGIHAAFLPHLFDRFNQQASGFNKSFAGLGIGLTIVKHLVDVHGGTIEASSLGEGQGARFTVRIPLTDQPVQVQPTEASAPLEGFTVLVVEDDVDARAFVSRVLVDAGAQVAEAASADEALALLRASTPSVLVSDIGMAEQNGYQLIRNVRESGYNAQTLPAIALTAFSRAQDRAEAIKAGFQVHLTKPIAGERLTAAVAALGQRRTGPRVTPAVRP
jgi:signal transduction histidine kinase/CheY-like chemotaxis protein